VCDAVDVCPWVPDATQRDGDEDGVGDVCECATSSPWWCVEGGGDAATDCLLEINPVHRMAVRGTRAPVLECADGDPECDADGEHDGRCTFRVALCVSNADPRMPACTPTKVDSVRVVVSGETDDRTAERLEASLAALGPHVRRGGRLIVTAVDPWPGPRCGRPLDLVVPAPVMGQGAPAHGYLVRDSPAMHGAGRRIVRARARAADGRVDRDRFIFTCLP
jgi:hypothetical protein